MSELSPIDMDSDLYAMWQRSSEVLYRVHLDSDGFACMPAA